MRLLRDASRWVFFAALIYAPWAYGCTTAVAIVGLNWLLGAALALWVVELLTGRRKLKIPGPLLLSVIGLLAIGGWMVLNAVSIHDSEFGVFVPLRNLIAHAPGSVDYIISAAWMTRGALLLLVILFVIDHSRDDGFVLRLWWVIAIAGGSLALLGLLQKATGAEMIFWQPRPRTGGSMFFATFYYHANAGAFLNLVLPLTTGLALRAFSRPASAGMRATGLTIFILNLGAIAANTSRMAQLIALVILVALVWQLGPGVWYIVSRARRNTALAGAAAILFLVFALAQASHLEHPLSRWQSLTEQLPKDARWVAAKAAVHALPDAGLVGFGPGTFRVVFPLYNSALDRPAQSSWRFLHQDYLQTLLEWGWIGSGLWAFLFFGGIAFAIGNVRKRETRDWSPRRRLILPLAAIALGGVALHALVDFPLQIASIQLYVATYLGLCWGSGEWSEVRGRRSEIRSRRSEVGGEKSGGDAATGLTRPV
jgi:hypothetical protein